MASVTGKTSEKIDEITNAALVTGELDAQGQLVLTTRGGAQINAGSVSSSIVAATINGSGHLILTNRQGTNFDIGSVASKALDAWPVGSIFMGVSPTNPATLLGGGTWVAWGQGRVVTGVDPTQAEFDSVEEIGGAKSVDVVGHTHTIAHTHEHHHYHPLSTGNNGAIDATGALRPVSPNTQYPNEETTSGASTPNSGTSGAHNVNVLQPYITAYLWKRTA